MLLPDNPPLASIDLTDEPRARAPSALERLLERATARLDAAAVHFERGALAWLRFVLVPLGICLVMLWAAQEIGLHGANLWNGFLLQGGLICALSVFIFALRFRVVMSIFEVKLRPVQTLRITALSMFYHCFVPLSAGADLTKFIKLRALAPARRPLFMAGGIVLDHLIGLVSLLIMAVSLCLVLKPAWVALDPALVLVALVTAIVGWITLRRQIFSNAQGAVFELLRTHRPKLVVAFALSVLMQCLTAFAIFAGSRGWNIDIGYLDILLVLTASFILQAIPLNIAGIGAADVAGTGIYVALGLPPAAAVLLVSLMYAYRMLIAALGGLWDLAP